MPRSIRRATARHALAAALALGCLTPAAALAQERPAAPAAPGVPTFGATTELVYVRFHVEKKGGGYAPAVTRDQIRVLEDGRPQEIVLLETPSTRERTVPPEVTLALDVSSSVMDERLLDEALVRDVLFASLRGDARVSLCAFGGELRCPTPPTRDPAQVLAGFQRALRFGMQTRFSGTRLYASLAEIARGPAAEGGSGATPAGPAPETPEKAQRAIVVFSDGLDNRGGKAKEAVQAALAADVRVYTVTLSQAFQDTARGPLLGGAPPSRALYDYRKFDLAGVARDTGGRGFEPGTLDTKTLTRILREIAAEISMENVVGYQPQGAPGGRRVRVRVELVDKSLGRIPDGERTLVR